MASLARNSKGQKGHLKTSLPFLNLCDTGIHCFDDRLTITAHFCTESIMPLSRLMTDRDAASVIAPNVVQRAKEVESPKWRWRANWRFACTGCRIEDEITSRFSISAARGCSPVSHMV